MDDRGLEIARFQWEEGSRRLRDAEDPSQSMERVVEEIVHELRRRLGGPFMAAELLGIYEAGTDWCLQKAMAVAPANPEAWDAAIVTDAAFARYLREASDYAGGRILSPFERDMG